MNYTVPCCEYCGAEKPDTVTIGDLSATYNGCIARYKGERLALQPGEVRILWHLMRRGRASIDTLAMVPNGEPTSTETVRQRVCHMRRKFAKAELPFSIITLGGYGYSIEPDVVT